jgi:uncharacterized membrane protein YfcA
LDTLSLAIVFAGFFVASTVKGIAGIGQVTTALAILGSVVPLRELVPLLVLPAFVSNLIQAAEGGGFWAMLRRFWLANAAGCTGVWLGTVILYSVDPRIPTALLGVLVCGYSLISLFAVKVRVPSTRERIWSPVVGFVSGVLTGSTGSLHLLLATYYEAVGLVRDKFIQANAITFLIASVVWTAALVEQRAMTRESVILSAAILVPAFAGLYAGRLIRHRVPYEIFRKGLLALLIVLGLNLMRKAFY